MNKLRRSQIEKVIAKIEEAKSELENIRDDEQDYFDNMPESKKKEYQEVRIILLKNGILILKNYYKN